MPSFRSLGGSSGHILSHFADFTLDQSRDRPRFVETIVGKGLPLCSTSHREERGRRPAGAASGSGGSGHGDFPCQFGNIARQSRHSLSQDGGLAGGLGGAGSRRYHLGFPSWHGSRGNSAGYPQGPVLLQPADRRGVKQESSVLI
jgi:hypothetical protein